MMFVHEKIKYIRNSLPNYCWDVNTHFTVSKLSDNFSELSETVLYEIIIENLPQNIG